MRTLVITFDNDSLLCGYRASLPPNVDMANIFRRVSRVGRIIRGVASRIGIMPRIFLESWFNNLTDYSLIIIMDSSKTASTLYKTLRNLGYSGRICYYFWNTVKGDRKAADPRSINRRECELWSFDPRECQEYNMHFNPSFYSREFVKMVNPRPNPKSTERPCAYFMGLEKGRLSKILSVRDALNAVEVRTKFYVVKDDTSNSGFDYSKAITYKENLRMVAESDIVVEITKPGQDGVTIRTLEALFFGKKLITDNQSVRSLNLYRENNVYIIDDSFPEGLASFIKTPYVKPSDKLLDYYSLESWLDRFRLLSPQDEEDTLLIEGAM